MNEEFNYPAVTKENLSESEPEQSPSSTALSANAKSEPPAIASGPNSALLAPDEDIQNHGEHSSPRSSSSERNRPPAHATAAQLEALYSAGLSGDVSKVRALLEAATSSGDFETFALVNDASPRTGLTVVHAAASRGHVNLLKWCMLLLVYTVGLAMPPC